MENISKELTREKAAGIAPNAEPVRDGDGEFLFGTDAAEFTEHSAKDQGGTKLGNTHRHIMRVEKISQGRFPSCARLLVTSRSVQQQIVSF